MIHQRLEELDREERKIRAKTSFLGFIQWVSPWIPINDYIEDVCEFIDDIIDGIENGRDVKALLEAPVRHMKSILVSQHLPAYFIGRNKGSYIICCSASDTLLRRNSRRMESILRQPEYIELFGDAYAPREDGMDRINSANEKDLFDGLFSSYTVGSAILGTGANLLIIDDPFRNTKHAFSITEQENIYEWYSNDIISRLEGKNGLLIMHQRLHERDLAGRIKEDVEDFKNWHYRSYKAIKDDGTALHEGLVSLDRLLDRQRTMSNFEAMYQQSPMRRGGNIIKSFWFNEWDTASMPHPKFRIVYLVCDTALKRTGDYWVIQVWGRTYTNDKYLIDIYREQTDYDNFKNDLKSLYQKYKKTHKASYIFIEDKVSGTVLLQDLKKDRLPVHPLKADGSKFFRLSLVLPELKNGYVYIPKDHPNKYDFIKECERFRDDEKHDHDDMVDCLVYAIGEQCAVKSYGFNKDVHDSINEILGE